MPYLIVTVVLVALLGTVNLLLTLAVIRRLREHAGLLAEATGSAGSAERGIVAPGQVPGDFAATDTDARPVRRGELGGQTLVAFFSTDCTACAEALPRFVEQAATIPGGRDEVLAVVSGDGAAALAMAGVLATAARVVVEAPDGALTTAFQVRSFPSWCLLDRTGTVRDSDSGLDRLSSPAVA